MYMWASRWHSGKESACQCRRHKRHRFSSWVRKMSWSRDRLSIPVFLGFLCESAGKESTCSEGDLGSIPVLGRFLGEWKGYPLQYSDLENPMDCTVPGAHKEPDMTERFSLTSLTNPSITKSHYRNSSPASYVYRLRGRILSRC